MEKFVLLKLLELKLNFSLVFLILRLLGPDWNLHHWLP